MLYIIGLLIGSEYSIMWNFINIMIDGMISLLRAQQMVEPLTNAIKEIENIKGLVYLVKPVINVAISLKYSGRIRFPKLKMIRKKNDEDASKRLQQT
jgi:hypothetical protein